MPRATKTMVYSPEVKALIVTRKGTLDISDDIVSGRITRRIDAASDFSLTLNNRAANGSNTGKYTGVIGRMDRVVIFLKRLHWVQVFAGYTSVVPVTDLYPTTCTITGACTIKRLQNYYWNPYTTSSRDLMYQQGSMADTPSQRDSGIGNMLSNIMVKGANWKPDTVHIQNLPNEFLEFAKTVQRINETPAEVEEEYLQNVADLMGISIGGVNTNPGATSGTGGTLNSTAGSVAPWGPTTTYTMEQIIQQAYVVGIPTDQLATAAAICQAESSGKTWNKHSNPPSGSRPFSTDWGLWQINDYYHKDKMVGGTAEGWLDPGNNAKAMFTISSGGTDWSPWSSFSVDRNYLKFLPAAKQAVAAFDPSKIVMGAGVPKPPTNTTTGNTVTDAATASAGQQAGNYVVGTVQAIIAAGMTQRGLPYSWGGGGKDGPSFGILDSGFDDRNVFGFDCSGFVQYCVWQGTNGRYDVGGTTRDMRDTSLNGHATKVSQSDIKTGDIILTSGHVMIYIGNGQVIEAQGHGVPVGIHNVRYNNVFGIFRLKGVQDDGSVIAVPDGTETTNGAAGATGTTVPDVGLGSSEPIAEALFRLQFLGNADFSKNFLTDDLSYINTEPIFQTVKNVTSAAMRSFMSAPNGDFVAFYPDPFGIMGKSPAVEIEDVELVNFSISQNEAELTTHVFTAYNNNQMAGSVADNAWSGTYKSFVGMEDRAVMGALLNIPEDSLELNPISFYSKMGVRPFSSKSGLIKDKTLNYFQALYTFLQKWSDQFNTRIDMTFMPELYPGMRMKIKSRGVTVYVKEVTHDFSYDSGFSTSAVVNSPTTESGGIPGLVIG